VAGANDGKLVVVSGPSGAGKTTVLRGVFEHCRQPLVASVSATTRPQRPGEVDGIDYHFLTDEEFQRRRRRGDFLECFEVFGRGHWYGTLRREVRTGLQAGKWVVLEIDVQGALAVIESYPEAISIFVRPESLEELEGRLRGRGTETEEAIERRLARAKQELKLADRYRYQVVNDRVERAVGEICHILDQESGETRQMIDDLREDEIIQKVGGRFKRSTLIQKRLVALNAGARPMVATKSNDKMQIVIEEILADKIYLDTEMNVQTVPGAGEGGPPELDLHNL